MAPKRLTFLVGFGQICFSSNQIAGFFDHKYLWMKSIDVVDFLHGDNHQGKEEYETTCFWLGVVNWASRRIGLQDFFISISRKDQLISYIFQTEFSYQGKVAPETTFFGWVWLFVSIFQLQCRIFWWAISLERTNWYARDNRQLKGFVDFAVYYAMLKTGSLDRCSQYSLIFFKSISLWFELPMSEYSFVPYLTCWSLLLKHICIGNQTYVGKKNTGALNKIK